MHEEQQATMPSLTSNPNPNPPHADALLYQYSHGFDGLEAQPAFELDGAAASQTGMISQIADSTTFEQVAANTTISQPEPVQCEVCNITCNTKDVYEKHTQGKKHMKNMQKIAISSVIGPMVTPPATSVGELENKKHLLLQNGASTDTLLYCKICNVVCNNQDVFQTHLAGKKHSAKAASMQVTGTNDAFNPTSEQGPGGVQMRCELCKISCTSMELLNSHMSGRKHLKKLKESGQVPAPSLLDTPTIKDMQSTEGKAVNSHDVACELCGINCNTYEVLKIHLSGKKHQKKLEKSEKPNGPCTQEDEEGKVVNNKKTKRVGGGDEDDLEAKRQKILQGGAASDALRTCTVCNVVCSSPTVYISHLAGRKHAAMAVKEAETRLTTGQQT